MPTPMPTEHRSHRPSALPRLARLLARASASASAALLGALVMTGCGGGGDDAAGALAVTSVELQDAANTTVMVGSPVAFVVRGSGLEGATISTVNCDISTSMQPIGNSSSVAFACTPTADVLTVLVRRNSDGSTLNLTRVRATTVSEIRSVGVQKYGSIARFRITGTELTKAYIVADTCLGRVEGDAELGNLYLLMTDTLIEYECKPIEPTVVVAVTDINDVSRIVRSASFDITYPTVTFSMSQDGVPLGDVVVQLRPDAAPDTVANFVQYVEDHFYDGTIIHRVVKASGGGFPFSIIQGGGYTGIDSGLSPPLTPQANIRSPIALESTGLSHKLYSIGMARLGGSDTTTATSQFFVNVSNNSAYFDPVVDDEGNVVSAGYAVFGTVIGGRGIVDQINNVTTQTVSSTSEIPVPNIVITSAVYTPVN